MADPPSRPAPRWSWCGPVWDGRGGCASGRRPPVHVRGEVPHRVQLVIAHAVEQCVDLAADGARPGCGGFGLPALLGGNGVLLALEFGAFGSDTGFLCGACFGRLALLCGPLLADQALFLLELAPLFGQAFGFDALSFGDAGALRRFYTFPFGTFRGELITLGAQAGEFFAFGPEAGGFGFTGQGGRVELAECGQRVVADHAGAGSELLEHGLAHVVLLDLDDESLNAIRAHRCGMQRS